MKKYLTLIILLIILTFMVVLVSWRSQFITKIFHRGISGEIAEVKEEELLPKNFVYGNVAIIYDSARWKIEEERYCTPAQGGKEEGKKADGTLCDVVGATFRFLGPDASQNDVISVGGYQPMSCEQIKNFTRCFDPVSLVTLSTNQEVLGFYGSLLQKFAGEEVSKQEQEQAKPGTDINSVGTISSGKKAGWKTYTDTQNDITFQYLDGLMPTVTIGRENIDGKGCYDEHNDLYHFVSQSIKYIANKRVCITTESESAAGTAFGSYIYTFLKDGNYRTGTFITLKYVSGTTSCGNRYDYTDPGFKTCQDKQKKDHDILMNNLEESVATIEINSTKEKVYKVTFNKNESEIANLLNDATETFIYSFERFLITLLNLTEFNSKDYLERIKFLEALKVKKVYSENNKSIVTYYLWLDKTIPKIDTSKKYAHKDFFATIQPESVSIKPYIFSDTYCKSDSDCEIGDGTGCLVGAFNKYKEVFYGPAGCTQSVYPAEDQAFLAQENAKCRAQIPNGEDYINVLKIEYSGASCISNKCTPIGRKVSCLE